MQDLKIWEEKIKEKRKDTNFRDFIMEIWSCFPLMFYKNQWFISKYPSGTERIWLLTSPIEFEKNRDNLINSWLDYSEKDFFSQFQLLFKKIKLPSLFSLFENENCDYVEHVFGAKDSYLSFWVWSNSEKVLYSCIAKDNCRNIYNSSQVIDGSENIYMSSGITKSYNIFYSKFITGWANIWFSTNLIGCSECIFCDNLQNKSYCVKNIEFPKDKYIEQKNLYLREKNKFISNYKELQKIWENFASKNVKGSFIIKSENIQNWKYVYHTKNGRNLFMVWGEKWDENMYDVFSWGSISAKNAYGCTMFWVNSENLYLSWHIASSLNIYHSFSLENCSYCLGCIWIKNKYFCILNKQYTKEEWYELADKIFASMEKDWILGDFFPWKLNPFYFNDTMAYLIDDSFTKEEVEKAWYMWRDDKIKVDISETAEIVETKNLLSYQGFDSNGNWKINPEILKKVIVDSNGNYYKIVPMEYDFLVKYELPLPEIHWIERIKLGFNFN
jgi:hypothetical protein